MANGLDEIRSASNRALGEEIIKSGGAILSEYEPLTTVRDFKLLARNRLVSGLSDALIVTEAALRSGTTSTVNHALDQNKEIFIVPGNITSPMSARCNALLKQGASPVMDAEDVIEVIAPHLLEGQQILPLGSTLLESKRIELIQSGVQNGEELQSKSGAEASEFSQTLTMLEINGIIRALGGNQWTLK